MKYVVDQNEMKAIDTYSIEKIGIPSLVLMERAAAAVAQKVEERMMPGDKVLAVAGSGGMMRRSALRRMKKILRLN